MAEENEASENVTQKIIEYEKFVNERLKTDLDKILKKRDGIYQKISEYMTVKNLVKQLESNQDGPPKTMVDLGCNFYCQGKLSNAKYIPMAVGFGFFVEMTWSEATIYADKQVEKLTKEAELLTNDSANVKAHIKLVLEALRELQGTIFAD